MRRFLSALMVLSPLALLRAEDPPKPDPYDQSKVELEKEPPADFQGKRVLVVAGSKSHGPGDHEFFAGCAILCDLLKQTPGVFPIMARDGWPKNEKLFETADCVVMYMDGRGGHPVVQGKRMELLQKQIDRGAGWVNLHYAVDYLPQHGKTVLGWMGGYYEPNYSINPHWDAQIRALPKHPITQGVKPFTLRDEWYYGMRFVEDMKNVTPILQAVPPDNTRGTEYTKSRKGEIETMAWAYERPARTAEPAGGAGERTDAAKGRGFGFTGGHFHRNWADENFRRVVVNAILWAAKAEVPGGGAAVKFDPADLNKNLDRKGKDAFKPILPPEPPKK